MHSHGVGLSNSKADRAKDEAQLRAQFVVVPPGAAAQVISCPICKESLKFLEEDEEWVWRNAVKEDKVRFTRVSFIGYLFQRFACRYTM